MVNNETAVLIHSLPLFPLHTFLSHHSSSPSSFTLPTGQLAFVRRICVQGSRSKQFVRLRVALFFPLRDRGHNVRGDQYPALSRLRSFP